MEISFLGAATRKGHYPKSKLPRIAFAGRSNVGKSRLINSLLGSKSVARTSGSPGRTREIHFFEVSRQWVFVDLPGYGFARVSKKVRARWGPMIEEFLKTDERLKLVFLILDARHEPSPLDLSMKGYLEHFAVPYQVVATKMDKLSGNGRQEALVRVRGVMDVGRVVPYSSATGIGKKELWQFIREV